MPQASISILRKSFLFSLFKGYMGDPCGLFAQAREMIVGLFCLHARSLCVCV